MFQRSSSAAIEMILMALVAAVNSAPASPASQDISSACSLCSGLSTSWIAAGERGRSMPSLLLTVQVSAWIEAASIQILFGDMLDVEDGCQIESASEKVARSPSSYSASNRLIEPRGFVTDVGEGSFGFVLGPVPDTLDCMRAVQAPRGHAATLSSRQNRCALKYHVEFRQECLLSKYDAAGKLAYDAAGMPSRRVSSSCPKFAPPTMPPKPPPSLPPPSPPLVPPPAPPMMPPPNPPCYLGARFRSLPSSKLKAEPKRANGHGAGMRLDGRLDIRHWVAGERITLWFRSCKPTSLWCSSPSSELLSYDHGTGEAVFQLGPMSAKSGQEAPAHSPVNPTFVDLHAAVLCADFTDVATLCRDSISSPPPPLSQIQFHVQKNYRPSSRPPLQPLAAPASASSFELPGMPAPSPQLLSLPPSAPRLPVPSPSPLPLVPPPSPPPPPRQPWWYKNHYTQLTLKSPSSAIALPSVAAKSLPYDSQEETQSIPHQTNPVNATDASMQGKEKKSAPHAKHNHVANQTRSHEASIQGGGHHGGRWRNSTGLQQRVIAKKLPLDSWISVLEAIGKKTEESVIGGGAKTFLLLVILFLCLFLVTGDWKDANHSLVQKASSRQVRCGEVDEGHMLFSHEAALGKPWSLQQQEEIQSDHEALILHDMLVGNQDQDGLGVASANSVLCQARTDIGLPAGYTRTNGNLKSITAASGSDDFEFELQLPSARAVQSEINVNMGRCRKHRASS